MGDCFSYALSVATGEPLLFKGDDFRRTDRRNTVSFPDMGKADYLEWHRSLFEHFDTASQIGKRDQAVIYLMLYQLY